MRTTAPKSRISDTTAGSLAPCMATYDAIAGSAARDRGLRARGLRAAGLERVRAAHDGGPTARRRRGGDRRGRHVRGGRAASGSQQGAALDDLAGTSHVRLVLRAASARSTCFPPATPEVPAWRLYRRWAFESAALDLALRQAGRSLASCSAGRRRRALRRLEAVAQACRPSSRCATILGVHPAHTVQARSRRASGLRRSSRSSRSSTRWTSSISRPPIAGRPSTNRPIRASTGSSPRRSREAVSRIRISYDPGTRRRSAPAPRHASAGTRSSTRSRTSRRLPFPPRGSTSSRRGSAASLGSSRRTTTALSDRHPHVRRRPVRAGAGPRTDPVSRVALPPGRAERRRAARLRRAGAVSPGLPTSPLPPMTRADRVSLGVTLQLATTSAYRVVRSGCTFIAESTQAIGSATGATTPAGASGCAAPDSRRRCSPRPRHRARRIVLHARWGARRHADGCAAVEARDRGAPRPERDPRRPRDDGPCVDRGQARRVSRAPGVRPQHARARREGRERHVGFASPTCRSSRATSARRDPRRTTQPRSRERRRRPTSTSSAASSTFADPTLGPRGPAARAAVARRICLARPCRAGVAQPVRQTELALRRRRGGGRGEGGVRRDPVRLRALPERRRDRARSSTRSEPQESKDQTIERFLALRESAGSIRSACGCPPTSSASPRRATSGSASHRSCVGRYLDAIYPMVYPSHYVPGRVPPDRARGVPRPHGRRRRCEDYRSDRHEERGPHRAVASGLLASAARTASTEVDGSGGSGAPDARGRFHALEPARRLYAGGARRRADARASFFTVSLHVRSTRGTRRGAILRVEMRKIAVALLPRRARRCSSARPRRRGIARRTTAASSSSAGRGIVTFNAKGFVFGRFDQGQVDIDDPLTG